MQKKILIADDHPMIRKGLCALLEHYFKNIEIVQACSCNEIMRKLSQSAYSYLILDIILSDGTILEILPNIVSLYPGSRILIFSMQPAGIYQRALSQYGIQHYVSKTLPEDSIVSLLGRFLNNERPARRQPPAQALDNPLSMLTARELEILHYLLKGMGSNEIANILNIKYNTVSTVRTHIFEKSRTNNITELFDLATRCNLA